MKRLIVLVVPVMALTLFVVGLYIVLGTPEIITYQTEASSSHIGGVFCIMFGAGLGVLGVMFADMIL